MRLLEAGELAHDRSDDTAAETSRVEVNLGLDRARPEHRELPSVVVRRVPLTTRVPSPGMLAEIEMFLPGDRFSRDSRAALLAPALGSSYRYLVQLPVRAQLRTAGGYVIEPGALGRTLRFHVSLTTMQREGLQATTTTVLDRLIEVQDIGAWTPFDVDLSRWAGTTVALDLRVEEGTVAGTPATSRDAAPIWAGWAAPEVVSRKSIPPGYDLLWISLDTLRADRLGTYGYRRRATSPNLDRLASEGIVFTSAVSQAPWTRPSHRSMFSGNYPASKKGFANQLIARVLWQGGWRTGALTGGGQVDPDFGFHNGFETYRTQYWHEDLDAVARWYEANEGRKVFLFLHTFAIHDPYTDHRFARAEKLEPGRIENDFQQADYVRWGKQLTEAEKAYVDALYDGGIAALDEVLGELFRRLEESGRMDRTVLVITSDHGEELFDHGNWRHGANLWDHQLLVPTILHLPSALRDRLEEESAADAPSRIEQQIQLVDLYPTILDLLGVARQHEVQGRSLVPLLRGDHLEPGLAFSENVNIRKWQRRSFRTRHWKLVWQTLRGADIAAPNQEVFLYNLRDDPEERVDVSHQHPDAVVEYLLRMQRLVTGAAQPDEEVPEDIDPELRQTLRALGYID